MRKSDGSNLCMRLRNFYDLRRTDALPSFAAPKVHLLLTPRYIYLIIQIWNEIFDGCLVAIIVKHFLNTKLQRLLIEPGILSLLSDGGHLFRIFHFFFILLVFLFGLAQDGFVIWHWVLPALIRLFACQQNFTGILN